MCCTCCCVIVLLVLLAVLILAMSFKMPDYSFESMKIKGFKYVDQDLIVTVEIKYKIINPNDEPFSATVDRSQVKMWSLDKLAPDEIGDALFIGTIDLDEPLNVAVQSETPIVLVFDGAIERATAAPMFERLQRDCGVLKEESERTTKVRVTLADTHVSWQGLGGVIPEITAEEVISCVVKDYF
eukprot:gnl/MRDRNA2_/MRDRNA2_82097_c0_seq1.p1 gnl/MRDRNA2_/MRDRNA2_82097_c0~~gnl/MRDRNA2_/MRDRNA2_82097_c0_seq1.p1  ORF type:complete len:184 (+),score=29.85 gnl/MRDRNA2_/MRDRNA2_82097_c0_seq1:211-762(+)